MALETLCMYLEALMQRIWILIDVSSSYLTTCLHKLAISYIMAPFSYK